MIDRLLSSVCCPGSGKKGAFPKCVSFFRRMCQAALRVELEKDGLVSLRISKNGHGKVAPAAINGRGGAELQRRAKAGRQRM